LAGSECQIFKAEIRKAREPNSRLHRGIESRQEDDSREKFLALLANRKPVSAVNAKLLSIEL